MPVHFHGIGFLVGFQRHLDFAHFDREGDVFEPAFGLVGESMRYARKHMNRASFRDQLAVSVEIFDGSVAAEYVMDEFDPVQLPPGRALPPLDGIAGHAVHALEHAAFAGRDFVLAQQQGPGYGAAFQHHRMDVAPVADRGRALPDFVQRATDDEVLHPAFAVVERLVGHVDGHVDGRAVADVHLVVADGQLAAPAKDEIQLLDAVVLVVVRVLVALEPVLDEAVDPMQAVHVGRRRFVLVMGLVQRPDQRADVSHVRFLVSPVSHEDTHDISFGDAIASFRSGYACTTPC